MSLLLKTVAVVTYSVLTYICVVPGSTKRGQATKFVEDSIAGVRVGSPIGNVRRLYPAIQRSGNGVWIVSIGRSCNLEIVTRETENPKASIQTVTLERAALTATPATSPETDCDSLMTGRGLRFGAPLTDVLDKYRGITGVKTDADLVLYRLDNGQDCLAGRSPILNTLLIYWSEQMQRIQTVSIDASTTGCQELRDSTPETTNQPQANR